MYKANAQLLEPKTYVPSKLKSWSIKKPKMPLKTLLESAQILSVLLAASA